MENKNCFQILGNKIRASCIPYTFLVFAMSGIGASLPQIATASDAESKPLIFAEAVTPTTAQGNNRSFLSVLYEEMMARAGIKYIRTQLPAKRTTKMLESGQIDGDMARSDHAYSTRIGILKMPEPIISLEIAGMSVRKDIVLKNWKDLSNYRTGYILNWKISERLVGHSKNAVAVRTPEILFSMLEKDRLDVALFYVLPTQNIAHIHELPKVYISDIRLKFDAFMFIRREHQDKLPAIESALKAMKRDGSYDKILNEYILNIQ